MFRERGRGVEGGETRLRVSAQLIPNPAKHNIGTGGVVGVGASRASAGGGNALPGPKSRRARERSPGRRRHFDESCWATRLRDVVVYTAFQI